MKIDVKTLDGMKLYNSLLKEQNLEIKTRLEMRERGVINSLASISGMGQGPQGQTPITSLNPLSQNNVYAFISLDWMVLSFAYKTHGLIQSLCNMPVMDALRGGIEVRTQELDADEQFELMKEFKRIRALDKIGRVMIWTRLFGGGALILGVNRPMDEPLEFSKLKGPGDLKLYAAHRWEVLSPWRIAERYMYYGTQIDGSKVLTLAGKEAPNPLGFMLQGWGMSELEWALEDFNTYLRVKNVIYELLYEAKIDVYKFKDFAAQMLSAEAEQQTNKRMAIMNSQKNYNSALLLDKEDEFDQRTMTFSGLAEIYRESRLEISSAWKIPMSKLFGIPSTGFSSGEDDRENYHEMIESEIREPLRPTIQTVLELVCQMLFGFIPDDLEFDYKPLRLLGAKEQEEVDTSKFNRFTSLYDRGLLTSEELGELLAKDKLIDAEIELLKNPVMMEEESPEGDEDKEP